MDKHPYTNQLIHEKSPYLLQHAHNPVNWYPWGEEPFKIAREKSLPLLVSIGYATCHWCHVMERESFEDPDLAKLLNEHFVSIKIDREERPDLDFVFQKSHLVLKINEINSTNEIKHMKTNMINNTTNKHLCFPNTCLDIFTNNTWNTIRTPVLKTYTNENIIKLIHVCSVGNLVESWGKHQH